MAKGNSWKTRNARPWIPPEQRRHLRKRELTVEPQYTLDDLYITPLRERRRYDERGRYTWVAVERRTEPTGLRIVDDYLQYLTAGCNDIGAFCGRYGLKTEELSAVVFMLTGERGVRFRQRYQMRMVDELLHYTDLPIDEVARRSGLGSPNNLYLALRREYNQSATERRRALQRDGDAGFYRL